MIDVELLKTFINNSAILKEKDIAISFQNKSEIEHFNAILNDNCFEVFIIRESAYAAMRLYYGTNDSLRIAHAPIEWYKERGVQIISFQEVLKQIETEGEY